MRAVLRTLGWLAEWWRNDPPAVDGYWVYADGRREYHYVSRRERLVGRVAWLLWRRWIVRGRGCWVRLAPCQEHDPYSVQMAPMRDFLAGLPGTQTVKCRRCFVVLREFPS